jgi:solute carrier family 66, member 2
VLSVSLLVLQFLIGHSTVYVTLVGFVALGIEAILPIPQFVSHYQRKSVAGFRPSVVVAWLLGDAFKCSYFFIGKANVTWQFKLCALVQSTFDIGIAIQFCMYGTRQPLTAANGTITKEIEEMEEGVKR